MVTGSTPDGGGDGVSAASVVSGSDGTVACDVVEVEETVDDDDDDESTEVVGSGRAIDVVDKLVDEVTAADLLGTFVQRKPW